MTEMLSLRQWLAWIKYNQYHGTTEYHGIFQWYLP